MRTLLPYSPGPAPATDLTEEAWVAPLYRPGTGPAATACCCTAPAQVQVVMPPSAERHDLTEVLLCWHHYRQHAHAIAAAGGAAYDAQGELFAAPVR
jgi:hypothetical protein